MQFGENRYLAPFFFFFVKRNMPLRLFRLAPMAAPKHKQLSNECKMKISKAYWAGMPSDHAFCRLFVQDPKICKRALGFWEGAMQN